MTRGDVFRYNLAFALSRASKIVRALARGLAEAERYAVADHVVAQLKQRGDPWQLWKKRGRINRRAHSKRKLHVRQRPCLRRRGLPQGGRAAVREIRPPGQNKRAAPRKPPRGRFYRPNKA
jgi:hypothetical protein